MQTDFLRQTAMPPFFFFPSPSILFYKVSVALYKTICSPWHLSIFTAKKGRAMHFWQDNSI